MSYIFNNFRLQHVHNNTLSSLGIYHIFNKTIDHKNVFLNPLFADRFIDICKYYKSTESTISYSKLSLLDVTAQNFIFNKVKNKKTFGIKIFAFSLNPNHYHFLVKEIIPGFTSKFISNTINSFTKYFNKVKDNRLGPLFLKRYKRIEVYTDAQFVHLIRYINLNNYSSGFVKTIKDLEKYKYSSFNEYFKKSTNKLTDTSFILNHFKNKKEFKDFITDRAEYQKMLEKCKTVF